MEKWPGGRIRITKSGRRSYYIYRRINGKLYEVATRASTERSAMLELARFEADPDNYVPGGPARPDGVYLTPDLADEFLDWSARPVSEGGKGNSKRHVHYQSKMLDWWRPHLKGHDLRNLDLRVIEKPLVGTPQRPRKIIAIRALYTWLVQVKRVLAPHEDPTFRRLLVPQAKAAQTETVKAISLEDYRTIRAKLEELSKMRGKGGAFRFNPYWLDALDVLAGTGWHVTELERFSTTGEIINTKEGTILQTIHKNGELHKTLVSAEAGAAASRIRERALKANGERKAAFSGDSLRTALQRACDSLGIPRLHPGSLRHSIATHAVNAGAPIQATADFLGHKSKRTTKKFYATHAIPAKVPTFT